MLKKREEPIVTWVVEVPAKGNFFTLVQATNAAEARKLARDADEWFTMEDTEPGEVLDTSKAFKDSGHHTRAADEARADEAADESEPDDSED